MERIEARIEVLRKFGEALGDLKIFVGDVQDEIIRHSTCLEKEVAAWKGKIAEEADDHRKLVSRLRAEIERGKRARQVSGPNILETVRSFSTSVAIKSRATINESSGEFARVGKEIKSTDYSSASILSDERFDEASSLESRSGSRESLQAGWQQHVDESEEEREYKIDWEEEFARRQWNRQNLVVKEGWAVHNSTYEELHAELEAWTGKALPWSEVKRVRAMNGKSMFVVRFESVEDRDKVFGLRNAIGEKGGLLIGIALTHCERLERWKMLLATEKLRIEGRNVEFDDTRICVDGQWWNYRYGEGWRKA